MAKKASMKRKANKLARSNKVSPKDSKAFKIVGIGASAGGLEALEAFFLSVSPDANLAFVLARHLDPSKKSDIEKILTRYTAMPVLEIKNGMAIKPNHIFVIPPGFKLTISNGILGLQKSSHGGAWPTAVDYFFESLAKDGKKNAVGVILSGTGSDGVKGLKAIKAAGGTTYVQDPKSAAYDGMPKAAISSGAADFIFDPRGIAEHLSGGIELKEEIDGESGAQQMPSNDILNKIFSLLRNKTHVDFSGYKLTTIYRRIQRRMAANRTKNIVAYLALLQRDPEEVKKLYSDIFIHVTDFFRDTESFQALKEKVFPKLVKGKSDESPIRIWVPGCSTGEEAYSLAIVLFEYLEERGINIALQIFATDISEQAIQKARVGFYSKDQLKNVSEERLEHFFDPSKDGYKVKKSIRDAIIFSRHDVTNNPPFARIDLVSCRNVLIYFAPALQKKILPIFHYALNPGGYLLLGQAETPSNFSALFTFFDKTNKIYCKNNEAKLVSFQFPTGRYIVDPLDLKKEDRGSLNFGLDFQKKIDSIMLSKYAPSGVVVDANGEVLQIRGQIGSFIELPPGQPNYNLLKILRADLLPNVRLLLQIAKKKNSLARKEKIFLKIENKKRIVNIEVLPVNPVATAKDRHYLVLFEEPSPQIKSSLQAKARLVKVTGGKKDTRASLSKAQKQYVAQLQLELEATKEHQQSLADDFASAQEELTSTNEELQSTNEELQSTNEELLTAKEELQAANEELTTTNDELQNRNIEQNLLNASLEREKAELNKSQLRFRLLEEGVKDFAIFLLDNQGNVVSWNEGAKRLHGYEESEILGQHFSKLHTPEDNLAGLPEKELKITIDVGRFEEEGWRVRKDGSNYWANIITTAIRDIEGRLQGFVKVTRDLTKIKSSEAEIKKQRIFLDSLITNIPDMVFVKDAKELRFVRLNKAAEELLGYSSAELLGKNDYDFFPKDQADFFTSKDRAVLSGVNVVDIPEEPIQTKRGTKILHTKKIALHSEDGKAEFLLGISEDITDKKKAEEERIRFARTEAAIEERDLANRRTTFLAEISISLAASLDYHETLRHLAELSVPFLADWCTITLQDQAEGFECVAASHAHKEKMPLVQELIKNCAANSLPTKGTATVIQTGKSLFIPVLGDSELASSAKDESQLKLLRNLGSSSCMVVPILVRNKILGSIAFIAGSSGRIFMHEDLVLAEEVGRRSGIVMENAFLYASSQKAIQIRDEFLSLASHELKTPLTSLKMQSQMRGRKLLAGGLSAFSEVDLRKMVDEDEKQILRITRLIDDMLDITRLHAGKLNLQLERVDMCTLVKEVVERFQPQLQAAKCVVTIQDCQPVFGYWDLYRIEQVLSNLLSNAMKYAAGSPVYIGLKANDKTLTLFVRDQGGGISKENQSRIFEQFERVVEYSNKGSGLGLGLYIARQIIEAHFGTIVVESALGAGSTFTIELPLNLSSKITKSED